MKNIKKSILFQHYLNYINSMIQNNKLISKNLNDIEVQELYNKKYKLSEFDIYKYITALDHISNSLGSDKIKFTEGITKDRYKYNNILIDLFYHNIP